MVPFSFGSVSLPSLGFLSPANGVELVITPYHELRFISSSHCVPDLASWFLSSNGSPIDIQPR